jgi:hypothetical protein
MRFVCAFNFLAEIEENSSANDLDFFQQKFLAPSTQTSITINTLCSQQNESTWREKNLKIGKTHLGNNFPWTAFSLL